MVPENAVAASKALRTPRAAGVAGIVFSLLLTASFVLVRIAVPDSPAADGAWLTDPQRKNGLLLGLSLIPFSGIAFLWFIGVVRDRIGQREDRFFASVFLGSGLLFVGMLFVATAVASGLLALYGSTASNSPSSLDIWRLGRNITFLLLTTYAMRMAAVFTMSTATIGLYIVIVPRWISLLGYLVGVTLLVAAGTVAWVELLFPAWVFLVSLCILWGERRRRHEGSGLPSG